MRIFAHMAAPPPRTTVQHIEFGPQNENRVGGGGGWHGLIRVVGRVPAVFIVGPKAPVENQQGWRPTQRVGWIECSPTPAKAKDREQQHTPNGALVCQTASSKQNCCREGDGGQKIDAPVRWHTARRSCQQFATTLTAI